MVTPGNDAGDEPDCVLDNLETTQENIQNLFDRVKKHAQAVRAAAGKRP